MKPTTIIHPVFAALMTVGLAACQIDESLDPGIDQEFRTTYAATSGYGCQGCNSPVLNDAAINDLDLSGAPGASGVRLLGIIDPITQDLWDVEVDPVRHELRVWDGHWIAGPSLVGWELLLEDASLDRYKLEISHVASVPTWSNLSIPDEVVYSFEYALDGIRKPICPTEDVDDQFVTIIAGETYDRESITVNPADPAKFTLACAKEAVFKMKMLGYFPNSPVGDSPAERQATLKMLTADYCGTGYEFTAPGTPVNWLNKFGSVLPQWSAPKAEDLEAIWGPDGAICVNTYRTASLREDGGDFEDIFAVCGDQAPKLCDPELLATPHDWTTWAVP